MNEKYAALETDAGAEKAIYEIICRVYKQASPDIIHDLQTMKHLVDDALMKKFEIKLLDLIVDEQPEKGSEIRCRFWTYGPTQNLIGISVWGNEEDREKNLP